MAAANDDPVALKEGQASAKLEETSSEERLRRQLEECEEGWRRLKDQNLELPNMAFFMKRRLRKCKRKAMLSARASRTRLGDNAEMPPESLEDLNRLCDALMMKDAVSNEKVSSMKEDKATLKIHHQRCAHKTEVDMYDLLYTPNRDVLLIYQEGERELWEWETETSWWDSNRKR